jgi:pimeloyl-ACP methyl ester carboxylesterase
VLLLDQRGTGRSTPVTRQTLPLRGSAADQAQYLSFFRADSIVRDAELFRRELIGDRKWTVLGQSYGGFCTVTYLSIAPQGVKEALITGGLPGLTASAEDAYRAAYPRIERKNAGYYTRYPQDVETVRRIAAFLRATDVRLPHGGRLTVEAFQALGLVLGMSTGAETLHYIVEDAFSSGPDFLSDAFLYAVQDQLSFASGPLYAVLHEASYGQGSATAWAAERVRGDFPQFDADKALAGEAPVLFTGETIHPWMFDTDPALVPLRDAAELIAAKDDWASLYDATQLADNYVPAAAVVYFDDMYVDTAHSLETAAAIRGLKPWVTNEFEHDGVRAGGTRVFDRLLAMVRGQA